MGVTRRQRKFFPFATEFGIPGLTARLPVVRGSRQTALLRFAQAGLPGEFFRIFTMLRGVSSPVVRVSVWFRRRHLRRRLWAIPTAWRQAVCTSIRRQASVRRGLDFKKLVTTARRICDIVRYVLCYPQFRHTLACSYPQAWAGLVGVLSPPWAAALLGTGLFNLTTSRFPVWQSSALVARFAPAVAPALLLSTYAAASTLAVPFRLSTFTSFARPSPRGAVARLQTWFAHRLFSRYFNRTPSLFALSNRNHRRRGGMSPLKTPRHGFTPINFFKNRHVLMRYYGRLTRRQLRLYRRRAATRLNGLRDDFALRLFEGRLDITLIRMGWASSLVTARYFLTTGRVLVNGKTHPTWRYAVTAQDTLSIAPRWISSFQLNVFHRLWSAVQDGVTTPQVFIPTYMEFDIATATVNYISYRFTVSALTASTLFDARLAVNAGRFLF